ncbi:MAG: type IV pilin [Euryarchaeota archaeon]|nr:type IV pilin [Euryarchaeota archaeon]
MRSSISPLKAFLEFPDAITEVVGDILMTALVVVVFSVIAVFVLSREGPANIPHIETTGDIISVNTFQQWIWPENG